MNGSGTRPWIVATAAIVVTLGYAGLGAAAVGDLTQEPTRESTGTVGPDAFQASLTESLLEASEEGNRPIDGALNAAQAAIDHHLEHEDTLTGEANELSLEAQQHNIEQARRALDVMHDDEIGDLEESIRLAQLGTLWQLTNLGLEPGEDPAAPTHTAPSEAIVTLAERNGHTLDADTLRQAKQLDTLDSPLPSALTSFLDAFLGLEMAAEDLSTELPEPAEGGSERLEGLLSFVEDEQLATHEELAQRFDLPEPDERPEAPAGLADVMVQRVAFLDATLELAEAIELSTHDVVFDEPGLLSIDTTGEDSFYEEDYRLIVEDGGDNVYHNNAGGSNLNGGSCPDAYDEEGAVVAALVDLGEGDGEFGDPANPRFCGNNGGGFGGGWEHPAVGVGHLITDGGEDTYTTTTGAGNGGGWGWNAGVGLGLLVDAGGQDSYESCCLGANGGGAVGYFGELGAGLGLLVDGGGDDEFGYSFFGGNGAGLEWGVGLVHGGVLSAGGDDTFESGAFGGNGGTYVRTAGVGHGFIVNGGGTNAYDSSGVGGNGGAHSGDDTITTALLVDAEGGSSYTGNHQAINGGARHGTGAAALVSGPGSDTFDSSGSGANGGTHRGDGVRGLLVNAGGDNTYVTDWDIGTNGGTYRGTGYGTLFDVAGDDLYSSPDDGGVNGGVGAPGCAVTVAFACASSSFGLLLDGSGSDTYEDEAGGAGQDTTLVPKGSFGAQVDVPPTP